MSDVDPGSNLPDDAVVPSGDTAGDQPKKEDSKYLPPPTDLHPLEEDTLKKAEEFEEKRKTDLDEAREEHIRQRGNVTR